MADQPQALDLRAIKERQKKAWSTGDYGRVGSMLVIMAEMLCEAVDLHPGQRVLDVACGNGNTALAAARRFGEVVGVDYVAALLEEGRKRAQAEGWQVDFREGDAEDLPFPDASFDVVLSTLGAMFAPNQEKAASELLRVCRPGGKIGLANWTPDGFIGVFSRTINQHLPLPPGLKPNVLWGTEERLRELLSDGVSSLHTTRRSFIFRYPSAKYFVDYFRTYFGPTRRAFMALDETGQAALARDVENVIQRYNRSGGVTAVWPSDYLEVVATKR
jgi:ubiquinone/menaquinone biosynthesis C-methylase UbiE